MANAGTSDVECPFTGAPSHPTYPVVSKTWYSFPPEMHVLACSRSILLAGADDRRSGRSLATVKFTLRFVYVSVVRGLTSASFHV